MGDMLMSFHNISQREERPRKQQKVSHDDERMGDDQQKATFAGGGKGTDIAEYMRQKRKKGLDDAAATGALVDLTGGENHPAFNLPNELTSLCS